MLRIFNPIRNVRMDHRYTMVGWARKRPLTLGAPTPSRRDTAPSSHAPSLAAAAAPRPRASSLPFGLLLVYCSSRPTAREPLGADPALFLSLPGANASIAADLRAHGRATPRRGRPGRAWRAYAQRFRAAIRTLTRCRALVPAHAPPLALLSPPTAPPCAPLDGQASGWTAASCGLPHTPPARPWPRRCSSTWAGRRVLAALDRLGISPAASRYDRRIGYRRWCTRQESAVAVLHPRARGRRREGAVLLGPGDRSRPAEPWRTARSSWGSTTRRSGGGSPAIPSMPVSADTAVAIVEPGQAGAPRRPTFARNPPASRITLVDERPDLAITGCHCTSPAAPSPGKASLLDS
ncbi:hypothetical protein ZWY2020_058922 [Hordeum vulgare]|nr:hypothetical protein ZWY2020_058922 [Hordeum vulgare]